MYLGSYLPDALPHVLVPRYRTGTDFIRYFHMKGYRCFVLAALYMYYTALQAVRRRSTGLTSWELRGDMGRFKMWHGDRCDDVAAQAKRSRLILDCMPFGFFSQLLNLVTQRYNDRQVGGTHSYLVSLRHTGWRCAPVVRSCRWG